ncbi:hypothetical protein TNCV_4253161 [Trichonephila clavipes]|nr:hypothetical protein TNCV_4253161 [Trichonephila clavipes]
MVEGEERWEAPNHLQCVLPQNWGETERNRSVTYPLYDVQWHQDSNPQHSDHECVTFTTRLPQPKGESEVKWKMLVVILVFTNKNKNSMVMIKVGRAQQPT